MPKPRTPSTPAVARSGDHPRASDPSFEVRAALRPALAHDIGRYARDPNADVDGFAEWLRHLDAGRIRSQ